MDQTKIRTNEGQRTARKGGSSPPNKQNQDFGDTALSGVEEIKDLVSRSIRNRPIESALIALGIGLLCGRFRRSAFEGVLLSAGAGLAGGLLLARKGGIQRRSTSA